MTKSELKEDNQMLDEKLVELYERIEREKNKEVTNWND